MQTGIFDKTRLVANILMVVLVAMNIFFSINYSQGFREDEKRLEAEFAKMEERIEVSKFMKLFVDTVLGSNGNISFEDRVKLESDIRELGDENLVKLWEAFVASPDSESAQANAVKLMSMLTNKMI